MRTAKLAILFSLIITKTVNALAYHGTEGGQGGASIPSYSSTSDTLMFLILPFFVFTIFFQQVFQLIVEKRVVNDSWKDPQEYIQYSTIAAFLVVGLLTFTRVFHGLPILTDLQYGVVMSLSALIPVVIFFKDDIRDRFEV